MLSCGLREAEREEDVRGYGPGDGADPPQHTDPERHLVPGRAAAQGRNGAEEARRESRR